MPNPGCLCRRSAIGAFRCFEHWESTFGREASLVQPDESFDNRPGNRRQNRSFVALSTSDRSLFRPDIDRIAGYTPGEQPQESGWIKLNTNENPYPPSPAVRAAIVAAAEGRLNVYPDPLGTAFRKKAAAIYGVEPDWILPANGSDECLTLITRAFVDPGETICFPYPSYILYETLADLQGGRHQRLLLNRDWSWNHPAIASHLAGCKLLFVPNPNSPSGNAWPREEIERLVPPAGTLVLDGAYTDFAVSPDGADILNGKNGRHVILTRTLSKSYSMAGVRFGVAIAHPDIIRGLRKVKDSYNCNTLSLAAALAAIEDQAWMQQNVARIRATRGRLTQSLRSCGFDVVESQANFVWATRKAGEHRGIYEKLKQRKILVRYMRFPNAGDGGSEELDGLRITVGTDAEVDGLSAALKDLLA
jgi:histidinol-phosphate aminotransferase